MHYIISYDNPHSQYIKVEMIVREVNHSTTIARLSAWRPGRYELGNFAKNIRNFKAYDISGVELPSHKIERERWSIHTENAKFVRISYEYYAGVLNAGSTYLDEDLLYMNPVNCCMYIEGKEGEECIIQFKGLPKDRVIASGLDKTEDAFTLSAPNFDQLADRPLMWSSTMKLIDFETSGLKTYLWFQGECKLDKNRIKNDFIKFIDAQIKSFGEFPEKEFHFLFIITPHKTHHGVEHENSTVCMIGPTYHLMGTSYDEFLGLSSHEFYHSWNIKKIRPKEMLPYDYTQENYSTLGYVAEGVTTYYGDLMCYRSGVFTFSEYKLTLVELLEKHFHNYARFSMSVAEASFDTWIDGYEAGVPHRKVSIYTEGAIAALISDIHIIHESKQKYSLDNVMYDLYHEYAKKGKGYSDLDYQRLIEKYMNKSWKEFTNDYIFNAGDYTNKLRDAFKLVGIEMILMSSNLFNEKNFGFVLSDDTLKVLNVAPDSPAEKNGIVVGDLLLSINGFSCNGVNAKHWFNYFRNDELNLRLRTYDNKVKHIVLPVCNNDFYPIYDIEINSDATAEQIRNRDFWLYRK